MLIIYVLISLIIFITLLKNISKSGIIFNWCLKDAAQALEKSSFLFVKFYSYFYYYNITNLQIKYPQSIEN